ncbi:PP0621 family protein [Pseudomonas citronellolis]|uniref:PP0621 family protein n=1 Tax=Pseudomonas citronellolis TaxID=53408 RepID=UPI00248DB83F|nr:PP0621 family protein [Pseudomonas citronellolis]
MVRLLFWILLIALIWWLWRKATRPQRPPQAPLDDPAEPMVRCAQCGVHVPRANALQHEQRWYCSQAHLQQDSQRHG